MKNKILVCLFLVIGLLTYAQKEEYPPNGPRGVVNLRDELNRRQGLWSYYNIHGDLINSTEYVNNKREGVSSIYYPGGGPEPEKIKEETTYFSGKKDGPHAKMYLEGQASIEGEYNMGKKHGTWTLYFEDGQTQTEGAYEMGLKDGEWKYYDRKGNLLSSTTFDKGVDASAPKPVKDSTKGKGGKPGIKGKGPAKGVKGTPPAAKKPAGK